ncbi:MAG: hypothetical protein KKA32_02545 [Actinobacteria bacterium]|nr:hypothetical protein [Actinomycetota bacterium]
MRTEIRLSASAQPSPNPWLWWVWEQSRLVAKGQSPTEEEAQQAVSAITGLDPSGMQHRPLSSR